MTRAHLMTATDQKHFCIYCSKAFKKRYWKSEFASELHYKTMECECGSKIRIKVDFHGSGHDSWGKIHPSGMDRGSMTKVKTLEAAVITEK